MRRIALVFVFSVAGLLDPMSRGVARAQTAEPTATELAEAARRAHDRGQIREAIDGYARAYQLSGDSELLFNLAEAHREAGQDTDALRTFQTYLRRTPEGPHHESAAAQIKELEQKVKQGGSSKAPGVAASPAPTRPPTPPVRAAPAPVVAPPRVVTSAAGADLTRQAQPTPSESAPPLPRWVPWAAGIATVALGTGAIITGLSASKHYDDLKNSCGQTNEGCATDQVSDVRTRAHRANLLWALTGVAAVGTGVTVYVNASAAGASGLWSF